jgi:hypothetical protein
LLSAQFGYRKVIQNPILHYLEAPMISVQLSGRSAQLDLRSL